MLGHRGCRLGITYPEITEMQARAIFEAACRVVSRGKKVTVEVMIPLVALVEELRRQTEIVRRVAREVFQAEGRDRKSTRLNSSHGYISYAVFCLKKKKETKQ